MARSHFRSPELESAPTSVETMRSTLLSLREITDEAVLRLLPGGVSSVVAHVIDGNDEWVAKTPLHRLSVAQEWIADRRRGANEAAILRFLGGELGPMRTPRLRFFNAPSSIIGEEYFAGPPPTYKDLLLSGLAQPKASAELGVALSSLQRLTAPAEIAGDGPRLLFSQLRLEPFYLATARVRPELRDSFFFLSEETMSEPHRHLVHGDFTPKNVLIDMNQAVLLDWECVHVGDPAFDPATLIAHLALKSLRGITKEDSSAILVDARRFASSYQGPARQERILRHAGGMMLSRLYGKSPVNYLADKESRDLAHEIGVAALRGEFRSLDDFMDAAYFQATNRRN